MQPAANYPERTRQALTTLMLGAMGVVYGDIGTSPLYTLKEAFTGHHSVAVTHDNVLGILSLVFWSLMIIVTLKYVTIIMRADNRGEGGIMALTALVLRATHDPKRRWILMVLGLFGAALFYGDSMITPAISVLSAVEGLEVATPALKPYVVPIAIGVLIALFAVQRHGTARVGAFFGPVMLLWFSTLGALGIWNVLRYPEVLEARQSSVRNPVLHIQRLDRILRPGLGGARGDGRGGALRRHGPLRPQSDPLCLALVRAARVAAQLFRTGSGDPA